MKYATQELQSMQSKLGGIYDNLVYYPVYQGDEKVWRNIKEISFQIQEECDKAIALYKGDEH